MQSIVNSKELKLEVKNDKADKGMEDITVPKKDLYSNIESSFKGYVANNLDLLQARTSSILPKMEANGERENRFGGFGSKESGISLSLGEIKSKSPSRRLLPLDGAQGASLSAIIDPKGAYVSDAESEHRQFYSMHDIEIPAEERYNSAAKITSSSQNMQTVEGDEMYKLMSQVNELETQKRGIQRLLKSENQDLADKESELEKLQAKLNRKQHEFDLLLDNHDQLKQ